MTTAQQIIDLARVPLNDDDKDRYSDDDGLRFLNTGLARLKRVRPDLFLGSLGTAWTDLTLTSAVPTPPEVDQALADYVTGRLTMRDDEESKRVDLFLTLSGSQL